jgi:biopolymer transport protein ExbD
VVSIDRHNTLWVDEMAMDLGEATRYVAAVARAREWPVLITGDRHADLGVAIELLAGLRAADIETVSFQVREE